MYSFVTGIHQVYFVLIPGRVVVTLHICPLYRDPGPDLDPAHQREVEPERTLKRLCMMLD